MEYVKYVCPKYFYKQKEPGVCPNCGVPLLSSCPVGGNPIVGKHNYLAE
jgi:hypothetical protein